MTILHLTEMFIVCRVMTLMWIVDACLCLAHSAGEATPSFHCSLTLLARRRPASHGSPHVDSHDGGLWSGDG